MPEKLHPKIDNGLPKESAELCRRHAGLRLHQQAGEGEGQGPDRPQPRLRLHQVLEAGGRGILGRCRRPAPAT